jgi:hypothetical protein
MIHFRLLKKKLANLKENQLSNLKIIDELKNSNNIIENNFRNTEKTLECKLRENSERLLSRQNEVSLEHSK